MSLALISGRYMAKFSWIISVDEIINKTLAKTVLIGEIVMKYIESP
jgi:hypothetical protein